jgi:hypothetical protein
MIIAQFIISKNNTFIIPDLQMQTSRMFIVREHHIIIIALVESFSTLLFIPFLEPEPSFYSTTAVCI